MLGTPSGKTAWSLTITKSYSVLKGVLQNKILKTVAGSVSTLCNPPFCFCLPINTNVCWHCILSRASIPKLCEKKSQVYYSGGCRTHELCSSRVVSYQLDNRDFPVARGGSNPSRILVMLQLYRPFSKMRSFIFWHVGPL